MCRPTEENSPEEQYSPELENETQNNYYTVAWL